MALFLPLGFWMAVHYISFMTDTDKSPANLTEKPVPADKSKDEKVPEHGGPKGPEPTRYGDWEIGGKCVDF